MKNRFPTQIHFLSIFLVFVTLVVVAGGIFGMDPKLTISTDLTTKVMSNREPMALMNGKKRDWMGLPLVHQVTQRNGTMLRVRSYIQKVVEVNTSDAKAISF